MRLRAPGFFDAGIESVRGVAKLELDDARVTLRLCDRLTTVEQEAQDPAAEQAEDAGRDWEHDGRNGHDVKLMTRSAQPDGVGARACR